MEKDAESLPEAQQENQTEDKREAQKEGDVEHLTKNQEEDECESETKNKEEGSAEEMVKNAADTLEERTQEDEKAKLQNRSIELIEEYLEEIPKEEVLREEVQEDCTKPTKKYKKIVTGISSVLAVMLAFYLGMAAHFMEHFYFGSTINGIDVSGKSVSDVEELMATEFQDYALNLKERGGNSEQIKADEAGLGYYPEEIFKALKQCQNPFSWPLGHFNTKATQMTAEITYDEKLLEKRLDALACLSGMIVEPKNPSFYYADSSYLIAGEILGNKIDKERLHAKVKEALLKKETEIDLEAADCYINPKYQSKSQKIIAVKELLNHYTASKITYVFGDNEEILDGSTINKWLTVDEDFEIIMDEKEIGAYIEALSKKYNTPGRTRSFTTSSGNTVKVSGGDFTRPINQSKEIQSLTVAIKEGQTITREPIYGEEDASDNKGDIGSTYVEIDLTKQYIWFYKEGTLITEGNVVTGNVRSGHTTPKGIYSLKYKAKNVVLRGPGYAAPVTFWMPFNGGIGMHDASWRSAFGGEIYRTDGSHGCINCPYNVVSTIYAHIEPGTPIVCY